MHHHDGEFAANQEIYQVPGIAKACKIILQETSFTERERFFFLFQEFG